MCPECPHKWYEKSEEVKRGFKSLIKGSLTVDGLRRCGPLVIMENQEKNSFFSSSCVVGYGIPNHRDEKSLKLPHGHTNNY